MSIDFMTLSQMRGQVGRHIGDTTSTRNTKIDEWLNLHYADLAAQLRWPQLLRGSEKTLTFTAGDKFLYLPKEVSELYFIIPGSPIEEVPHQTIEMFFKRHLNLVDTQGRFVNYADAGEFGRRREFPTTAQRLSVQNIGAAASETQTVLIHGLVQVGSTTESTEIIETVSLTGSSAVNTTNSFTDLYQVSCAGTQTGYIQVTEQSDATVLFTVVEPGEVTSRYKRLRLGYVADGSGTYTLYYKRHVRKLTADNSTPELPIARVLVELAIASQFTQERKWQGAATLHQQRAQEMLAHIWEKTVSQASRIEQSVPLTTNIYQRRSNTIVVSNG
jgi:hypothetical protein